MGSGERTDWQNEITVIKPSSKNDSQSRFI